MPKEPNEPRFELESKLPTYSVSVEMLRRIEASVRKQDEFCNAPITITINEPFGEQSLSSIENYPYAYLPVGTRSVTVWAFSSPRSIRLGFHSAILDSMQNRLKIDLEGVDSRERCISLRDEILRVLEPYETLTRYFNNVPVFVTIILIQFALSSTPLRAQWLVWMSYVPLPLIFAIGYFKPRITFVTKRTRHFEIVVNAILGAIGAGLVGAAITAIIDKLSK